MYWREEISFSFSTVFVVEWCSFHLWQYLLPTTRFMYLLATLHLLDVGKHSLLVTLTTGMVLSTRWWRIALASGLSIYPMSTGNLPSLTIPGLKFDLGVEMEYGLIGFPHGFVMQLLMPPNSELLTMVFTGIRQLVKGILLAAWNILIMSKKSAQNHTKLN